MISIGALFSAAWARFRRAWLGFTLLFALIPLGLAVAVFIVAALAAGAIWAIQGEQAQGMLRDPMRLYGFISSPENQTFLLGLGLLVAFLGIRFFGVVWKASTHLSLDPSLGFKGAWRQGNQKAFPFLIHCVLSFLLTQLAGALLFLPALVVMTLFGLSAHSFARDQSGIIGAFEKSFQISKGQFWALLVRLLVLGIACGLIMLVPLAGWVAGPALWLCLLAELFIQLSPQAEAAPVTETAPAETQSTQPVAVEAALPEPAAATAAADSDASDGLDQVFSGAWELFKQTWWKLSLLIISGLLVTVLSFGAPLGIAFLCVSQTAWPAVESYVAGGLIGLALASWIFAWFYSAILMQALEPARLPSELIKASLKKATPLFNLMAWAGFLLPGNLVLGLIPGIILAVRLTFAMPLLIQEGQGSLQALRGSLALVQGRFAKALGFTLVIWLASMALGNVPLLGTVFSLLLGVAFYHVFRKRPPDAGLPGLKKWIISAAAGWLLLLGLCAAVLVKVPGLIQNLGSQLKLASGSPPAGFEASWGSASDLPEPDAMAVDSLGALWVMGGPHVSKYLKIIRSDGSIVWAAGEQSPTQFGFSGPIVHDARGFLYHSDMGFHTVEKLDQQGTRIGTVLAPGNEALTGTAHGPAGMAMDEAGNLYVAEMYNNRIQKLGPEGEYVTHWMHPVSESAGSWQPYGVAAGQGKVYVSSQNGTGIEIFDQMGGYLGNWNGQEDPRVGAFQSVSHVAIRPDGRILVSDYGRVMEFSPQRTLLGLWKAGEEAGWDAGPVAAASDGRVFIMDKRHNRILVGREAPAP